VLLALVTLFLSIGLSLEDCIALAKHGWCRIRRRAGDEKFGILVVLNALHGYAGGLRYEASDLCLTLHIRRRRLSHLGAEPNLNCGFVPMSMRRKWWSFSDKISPRKASTSFRAAPTTRCSYHFLSPDVCRNEAFQLRVPTRTLARCRFKVVVDESTASAFKRLDISTGKANTGSSACLIHPSTSYTRASTPKTWMRTT
jgi:hypothetical protein